MLVQKIVTVELGVKLFLIFSEVEMCFSFFELKSA